MNATRAKTIGLLYPGEMGVALAAQCAARGARVVTTLAERGPQSARRCRESGIEAMGSLDAVARAADVVLSCVPPAAAVDVAESWCAVAHLAVQEAIYVDVNSVSPETVDAIAARVTATGRDFVDAAVNGLAKNLGVSGTLFLSGARAGEVAALLAGAARVRVLGEHPGRASAMKMLLSGASKGVCALFIETALTAHRQGMLAEMIEAYATIYPGLMALVDRMLPTYAEHAARRADESRELEQSARASEIEPAVLAGVRALHEQLATVDFAGAGDATKWDVQSLIEHLAADGFLAADVAARSL